MVGSRYGTHDNSKFTFTGRINLQAGVNKVSLLSMAGGLPVSFLAPDNMNYDLLFTISYK